MSPDLDHVEYVTMLQKIREQLPQPAFDFDIMPYRESARCVRTSTYQDNYLCGPFVPAHMRDVRFYFSVVVDKRTPEASCAQLLIQDNQDWAFVEPQEVYDHTAGRFTPVPQEAIMYNQNKEGSNAGC
jgi:hypothetical protein